MFSYNEYESARDMLDTEPSTLALTANHQRYWNTVTHGVTKVFVLIAYILPHTVHYKFCSSSCFTVAVELVCYWFVDSCQEHHSAIVSIIKIFYTVY